MELCNAAPQPLVFNQKVNRHGAEGKQLWVFARSALTKARREENIWRVASLLAPSHKALLSVSASLKLSSHDLNLTGIKGKEQNPP